MIFSMIYLKLTFEGHTHKSTNRKTYQLVKKRDLDFSSLHLVGAKTLMKGTLDPNLAYICKYSNVS